MASNKKDDWEEIDIDNTKTDSDQDWVDVPIKSDEADWVDVPEKQENPFESTGEAIWRGAGQAAFGLGDEAEAAVKTVGPYLQSTIVDKSDKGLLDTYLQERLKAKQANIEAEKNQPVAYGSGYALGTAATLPVMGSGLAGSLTYGALTGFGESNPSVLEKPGEVAADVVQGLGTGAAFYGVGKGAEKAIPWTAKKGLSAATGIKDKIFTDYLKRPAKELEKVSGKSLGDIGTDVAETVKTLRDNISKGSSDSYSILEKSEGNLTPQDIDEIVSTSVNELKRFKIGQKEAGIGKQAQAGYSKVNDILGNITDAVGENGMSLVDAKKILQQLDQDLTPIMGASGFTPDTAKALSTIRAKIRDKLGKKVPEFNQKMIQVAHDAQLLDDVQNSLGSYEAITNKDISPKLKTIMSKPDKVQEHQTLANFGHRMGENYPEQIKDRLLLNEFDKNLTRGSKGVNLGALLGRSVAGSAAGGYSSDWSPTAMDIGAVGGAAMDRYGGNVAKVLLDVAKNPSMRKFGSILLGAAKAGGNKLILTHYLLSKNPEYIQSLNQALTPNQSIMQGEK